MTDVTHELARQVVDRGEDPAGDHIAFDVGGQEPKPSVMMLVVVPGVRTSVRSLCSLSITHGE